MHSEQERKRWRGCEMVHCARPATTLCDEIGIPWPLSLRFRRGGPDSKTTPHCPKLCGRTGVRWLAAYDLLRTLRAWIWMLTSLRAWIRIRIALGLPFRRAGRDSTTMVRRAKLCGRAGVAARWFIARDRLTALRDFVGGPLGRRFRRAGRDSTTMVRRAKLCGRAGVAVRWFVARGRLTALRDRGGGPLGRRFRRGGRDRRTLLHCAKL